MEIVVVLLIVIVLLLCFLVYVRNKAFNAAIMDTRKSKDEMIEVMLKRFGSDYKDYETMEYEEIKVKSKEGFTLKGYYYTPNGNTNKVMIIHHGYTANHYVCLQFAKIFFDEGFNVLLVDMRSHGESEGKYITYGEWEREDLDIWVNLIREKVGKDGVIGLHGQSMGGATVLMYGGKYGDKVDFIISDCAYSKGKEIVREQFKEKKVPFFPVYQILNRHLKKVCEFDMDKISPLDDIKNSKTPVLFIHGTGDELVPHYMSEDMFNAKNGEKDMLLLILEGRHVGAYYKDPIKYKNAISDFLKSVLG